MKKFLLFVLFFVLLLFAEQVQKPYTFQPGRVIKSSEINANFDVLYNVINGNLDGSNIKNNSIPKTKLIGYPFTGYIDLNEGSIYDTQISPFANIQYFKLHGVVDKFTNQLDINGLKKFLVIPRIDENIASNTSYYQYDNQLTCKKYVDWKVSIAGGGGGGYPGNYPIQSSDIADYTIKDTDIASNTLTSRVIRDGAITASKIAALSDKIYYETTTLIDNTSPDTTIVHKKYVDDKNKYVFKDYIKTANLTYENVQTPQYAIDGNYSTAAYILQNGYIIFDLREVKFIQSLAIIALLENATQFTIYFSSDGNNWNSINTPLNPMGGIQGYVVALRPARYIKIPNLTNGSIFLGEISILSYDL